MTYDFNFVEEGYITTTPYDFWFYLYIEYNILPEPINNLISIDIDEDTYFDSGNLYITMKNHFLIINLATMEITDMYTHTTPGKSLELLDYENIEKSDVN